LKVKKQKVKKQPVKKVISTAQYHTLLVDRPMLPTQQTQPIQQQPYNPIVNPYNANQYYYSSISPPIQEPIQEPLQEEQPLQQQDDYKNSYDLLQQTVDNIKNSRLQNQDVEQVDKPKIKIDYTEPVYDTIQKRRDYFDEMSKLGFADEKNNLDSHTIYGEPLQEQPLENQQTLENQQPQYVYV
jgi:hypothetical protein